MHKRTFLLLEILIAFVLVTICIIPLVRQPLKLYRQEMGYLETMEKERLADWTFTEVKEMLLKNEIPWEKIPTKGNTTPRFPLDSITLQIPGNKPKTIKRSFALHGRGEKESPNNTIYRQLGILIFLDNTQFEFRLPVQKINDI